jgi:lipoprotein-anchoring transpeptidase ErfK/SrfK
MSERGRLTVAATALALAVPMLLSGCSARATAVKSPPVTTAVGAGGLTTVDDPQISITPTLATAHVPVTAEIGANVAGGVLTGVLLTDAIGHILAGALRSDRSSWVPSRSLAFNTSYTAAITATSATGAGKTVIATFKTMAKPAGKPINTSINVAAKTTYGVAMPIVVTFGTSIPASDRAAVERRLFVQSSPVQMGIWSWQSATQVAYRPQTYWQTGTAVTVNTALAGMPIGDRPITGDKSATFTIGKDLEYAVNTKTHMLTITSNGSVIHKFPISAGRPAFPSWSGHFVIMDKQYYTVFNTIGIPGENYITPVHYAERLTSSGTFFHSAPWSVGEQGHINVSHGCINLAPSNAAWIYHNGQIGDPVSISGTPVHAAQGNGWTMWDVSWANFVKGSAVGFAQDTRAMGDTPEL